ncbi:MAG: hypothetical protein C0501_10840 [Isosphaera sp.]|nr:hypothetical protein [Isosphaera sp.]
MVAWAVAVLAAAGPGPELHVVGLYESYARVAGGGKVSVKAQVAVNRPGKDVTLVLSAYEPVTWQVIVGPNTRLTKVVLCGYHTQAAEVPKGIEVAELFHEGRGNRPYVSVPHSPDANGFGQAVRAVRTATGLGVASYQGTYSYDPTKPVFVDAARPDDRPE